MSFSDETLMAYADGELDEAARLEVEAAMRRDSSIARRVARLRAARDELFAEQGPSGGRSRQAANVVQLAAMRAQRVATQQAARKAARRVWGWREWSALGLVMVLGLAAGKFGLAHWQPGWFGDPVTVPTEVVSRNGVLVAQGRLDEILSQQMGGAAPSEGNVRVGLSFLSREGGYCRSFTLVGGNQDLVGLPVAPARSGGCRCWYRTRARKRRWAPTGWPARRCRRRCWKRSTSASSAACSIHARKWKRCAGTGSARGR